MSVYINEISSESKFTSHKEKRKVTELMDAIMLPLMDHLKDEDAEYVRIGLRILRSTESEDEK